MNVQIIFSPTSMSWCKSKNLKNGLTVSEVWELGDISAYCSPHAHENMPTIFCTDCWSISSFYAPTVCSSQVSQVAHIWIEMADMGFVWGALRRHQQCIWLCGPLLFHTSDTTKASLSVDLFVLFLLDKHTGAESLMISIFLAVKPSCDFLI